MKFQREWFVLAVVGSVVGAAACSSSDDDAKDPVGTGGSGGAPLVTGGATGAGGGPAAGGSTAGLGGTVNTGGFLATGGDPGAGGGPVDPGAGGGPAGTGGNTGAGAGTGAGGVPPGNGTFCLKPGSGDYTKNGPYTSKRTNVDLKDSGTLSGSAAAPTTAVIFAPSELETNCKHPVVAWGNGTGVSGADVYAFFNDLAASWGVVVIAADNSNSGSANFLASSLDLADKLNRDSTSPFFGKLSGRNGTSGHSQGGFAATTATTHPSVQAEVQVEGGGRPRAGVAFLALTGTADTIVGTQSPMTSYDAATGPAMFANYEGADHTTTPTLAGSIQNNPGTVQFKRFYAAWFRCFLADDPAACAMFKGGATCGVCKDPGWAAIQTKGM